MPGVCGRGFASCGWLCYLLGKFSVYTYGNNNTMATKKLSRAEIKAGLDSFPIESLLSAGIGKNPALTTKQKEFAKAVALGETKAKAYRQAYKADATPATMATAPYRLAADSRISAEIEAYKVALEAEKHRTPAQLRALLVQQLVQHSLDEDFPPAQRVQCLRLIGSLFDVGAFNEQKTTTVIHQSKDLRSRLLATLNDVTDAPVKDDALDLLAEINGVAPSETSPTQPTTAPPAQSGPWPASASTHTVSDIQSPTNLEGTPSSFSPDEVVSDFDK